MRVTYFGKDSGRKFKILVNGVVIATPNFNAEKGDTFFDVDYNLPETVANNSEILTVRFEAEKNSITAGIYGVRLIKL